VTKETEHRYYDNDHNNNDDNNNDDNNNDGNGAPKEGKIPLSAMIENVGDELRKAAQKDLDDLKDGEVPIMRFKE
jgi:hypothetical protein